MLCGVRNRAYTACPPVVHIAAYPGQSIEIKLIFQYFIQLIEGNHFIFRFSEPVESLAKT